MGGPWVLASGSQFSGVAGIGHRTLGPAHMEVFGLQSLVVILELVLGFSFGQNEPMRALVTRAFFSPWLLMCSPGVRCCACSEC
jgi:hypothetical protein